MLTQMHTDFLEQLSHHFEESKGSSALQKFKTAAWEHFRKLELPSRDKEEFRYITLRRLYAKRFALKEKTKFPKKQLSPYILPECRDASLVMINGHFCPELSCTGALKGSAVIQPLSEAMTTYGTFLKNNFAKSIQTETDPFVCLNHALQNNSLFVYLPPNAVINQPIQILNLTDSSHAALASSLVHIFAGPRSQVDIAMTNNCLSENALCNQVVNLTLEEGSSVRLKQFIIGNAPSSWSFDAVRATLKKNSSLRTVAVTDGSETVRNDYRVELAGENAETQLSGLWMLENKNEAHVNVLVDHRAPFCRSKQLFKGVLSGVSSSSFEGKILVRQAAQKTDAFQLNNNLLVSDRASAHCMPNLEIFADDVKASHGATIGQMDQEQIFYLKTRGYSPEHAKKVLINAFCQEILSLLWPSDYKFPVLEQRN